MKNTFVCCLFLFLGVSAQSQKQFSFKDRVMTDIYFTNWLNHQTTLKTKWYSRGVSVAYQQPFSVVKDRITFALGVGISNHNFYTNSVISTGPHPDTTLSSQTYVQTLAYDDKTKPKSNKLAASYIDFPVEFRLYSKTDKKDRSFKLFLGARAGYKMDVHTKMKNSTGKYKDFIFPDAEKWRYGLHFKMGYDRIFLYGFYSLNTVFKENNGVPLRPVSIGISYTLY